jgi:hypothetical protein
MKLAALLAVLLSATFSASGATVCRWVDDQGRAHLADTVPERYRLRAECRAVAVAAPPNAAQDRKLREYLDSEACFERYRNVNHSLKVEAFKHCKELPDPRGGPTR